MKSKTLEYSTSPPPAPQLFLLHLFERFYKYGYYTISQREKLQPWSFFSYVDRKAIATFIKNTTFLFQVLIPAEQICDFFPHPEDLVKHPRKRPALYQLLPYHTVTFSHFQCFYGLVKCDKVTRGHGELPDNKYKDTLGWCAPKASPQICPDAVRGK